jgi:hypothetical protein
MREYTLVPSEKLKNDVVTVSSDPIVTQQINAANENYRNNITSVKETLTPEIQLELLRYFKNHLRRKLH